MVEMLYVASCSINGFFLAQFILYFLLLNVYHAPSNTQKLVVDEDEDDDDGDDDGDDDDDDDDGDVDDDVDDEDDHDDHGDVDDDDR